MSPRHDELAHRMRGGSHPCESSTQSAMRKNPGTWQHRTRYQHRIPYRGCVDKRGSDPASAVDLGQSCLAPRSPPHRIAERAVDPA
eukprot:3103909-Rhodomonas_salina.2